MCVCVPSCYFSLRKKIEFSGSPNRSLQHNVLNAISGYSAHTSNAGVPWMENEEFMGTARHYTFGIFLGQA